MLCILFGSSLMLEAHILYFADGFKTVPSSLMGPFFPLTCQLKDLLTASVKYGFAPGRSGFIH